MKDITHLTIFLIFFGSSLAQEKDYSTKICDQAKGKEFFAQLDSCTLLAEQDFFAKIFDTDIQKAGCDLLSAKLQCWTTADRSYNCLTDDELPNIRNNMIRKEIEKANNQSDFLGESYVASCGLLRDFRANFVNKYYGSNSPCSYNQILEAIDSKKTCENALKKKSAFLETIANSVDAWTRIFCLEYIGRIKCQEPVLRCKNSQQKAITQQGNQEIFDKEERKYQQINGFENFSYNNCQRSSGRKRRNTFSEDSLDSAQIDDLKKIFDQKSTLSD
jgi:hypothetical protein